MKKLGFYGGGLYGSGLYNSGFYGRPADSTERNGQVRYFSPKQFFTCAYIKRGPGGARIRKIK